MVNKIFNAAVIGTGRIGYLLQKDKLREQPASHSLALKKNKKIKLVAGCDISKEKLNLWKKDYREAHIYDDHITLMENEKPDIVVISVDEINHLKIALDVIEYKPKLIILEKPVSQNLINAYKIKNASLKFRVPIVINHERRFSKDYIIVKKLLEENAIGCIHSINACLWSNLTVWSSKLSKTGGCSLIHDGTHLIDIVHFLFNSRLNKPVIDKIVKNKKGDIESLFLHYNLDGEKILYIELNGMKEYFGFEVEVRGSSGRIIAGNGYLDVFLSKPSPYYSNFKSLVKNKKIKRPNITRYFSNLIQNCVDYLEGNAGLISTIDDGIEDMEVLFNIEKLIKNYKKSN